MSLRELYDNKSAGTIKVVTAQGTFILKNARMRGVHEGHAEGMLEGVTVVGRITERRFKPSFKAQWAYVMDTAARMERACRSTPNVTRSSFKRWGVFGLEKTDWVRHAGDKPTMWRRDVILPGLMLSWTLSPWSFKHDNWQLGLPSFSVIGKYTGGHRLHVRFSLFESWRYNTQDGPQTGLVIGQVGRFRLLSRVNGVWKVMCQ